MVDREELLRDAPRSIEVINLKKAYRRQDGQVVKPVDDINLLVANKEMIVLLGPSGCGKTTLLRCVAGLERPDAGTIIIDGKIVFCSERGIYVPSEHREISMIFQSFALWPHMTVAQNVAYPLRCRKVPATEIRQRVEAALEMVSIANLRSQYPRAISGGQQQRVALARALVSKSSVILFDEPLSSVDAQVRAQLRHELRRLQREVGFVGLYVTHDQLEALELGHRVAVLGAGRISGLGTPRDIYERPSNSYVAGFVGAANLWSAKVLRVDTANIHVSTSAGELSVDMRPEYRSPSFHPGKEVLLVVRPENLALRQSGSATDNCLRVQFDSELFSGAYTEFIGTSGDLSVRAWLDNSQAGEFYRAADARLYVPSDKIHLIEPTHRDV
jgi:iron(III) transport system ATP-binding protein